MLPRTVAPWIVLLAGCAGAHTNLAADDAASPNRAPRLYIGHSQSGTLVVAASHYDAMSGLAVSSSDLGLAPRKNGSNDLTCRREVVTGSHIPRWICRYQDEEKEMRDHLKDWLDQPRLAIENRGAPGAAIFGRGNGSPARGPLVP
jgi:hypothetical protein